MELFEDLGLIDSPDMRALGRSMIEERKALAAERGDPSLAEGMPTFNPFARAGKALGALVTSPARLIPGRLGEVEGGIPIGFPRSTFQRGFSPFGQGEQQLSQEEMDSRTAQELAALRARDPAGFAGIISQLERAATTKRVDARLRGEEPPQDLIQAAAGTELFLRNPDNTVSSIAQVDYKPEIKARLDDDTGDRFMVSVNPNTGVASDVVDQAGNPIQVPATTPLVNFAARQGVTQATRKANFEVQLDDMGGLFSLLDNGPRGTVGMRGALARASGGLFGQFEVTEEFAKVLTTWFAGEPISDADLKEIATRMRGVMFRSKEFLTGEGSSRISEGERAEVKQNAGLAEGGAGFFTNKEQVMSVVKTLAEYQVLNEELWRAALGLELAFPVDTLENQRKTFRRFEAAGFNDDSALAIVRRLANSQVALIQERNFPQQLPGGGTPPTGTIGPDIPMTPAPAGQ